MDKRKDLIIQYLVILVAAIIYFLLRLVYRESVFFNFDMPRLALITQDFIRNGTFLTSQSYMQESSWLNVPWGPALVYFYSIFVRISSDPLVIADLLSIFHFISIVIIIKFGWRYFSPMVGVISGLLLATNPYWVIYSRIIYQPAPVITFIVISMYLLFSVIKDKNRLSTVLLPVSWVILFQIYIPTYSFILVSLVALLLNLKVVNLKSIFLGLILSVIICIPTLKFYIESPIYMDRFINAPSRFTPPEKSFKERLTKVGSSFVQIPLGGKFEWQTGYSYKEFSQSISRLNLLPLFLYLFFGYVLLLNIKKIVLRESDISQIILFAWALCSFVSLLILWVTDIVPRYFLISIPAVLILIAISIDNLMCRFKTGHITWFLVASLPFVMSGYWSFYFISYDNFIKNYTYPNGRFSDAAETPYIHFKNAMDWADNDAKKSGCQEYSISNNKNNLNYDVWMETKYVWEYVYKYNNNESTNLNPNCRYLLEYEFTAISLNINSYSRFGPFVVFKYYTN